MKLTNDDSEVNLANGEADHEFAEWKWASPEEVVEQVSCLKHILIYFNNKPLMFQRRRLKTLVGCRQWITSGRRMRK